MVPYDVGELFARMGGGRAAAARLDAFFKLNDGSVSKYAFLGNEPSLETPWLYDWAGAPWRTQAAVRRALESLYGPGVTDYSGNDELGTMAAWEVFASLGTYPEIPGSDELVLASPLFPHAVIRLLHGELVIDAPGAGPAALYVRSLRVNGAPSNRAWLRFSAVSSGGHLRFQLSHTPTTWGAGSPPPSYGSGSSATVCRRFAGPASAGHAELQPHQPIAQLPQLGPSMGVVSLRVGPCL